MRHLESDCENNFRDGNTGERSPIYESFVKMRRSGEESPLG